LFNEKFLWNVKAFHMRKETPYNETILTIVKNNRG